MGQLQQKRQGCERSGSDHYNGGQFQLFDAAGVYCDIGARHPGGFGQKCSLALI